VSAIPHGSELPREAPPLWGALPPGPHAVGFRSLWELDYGRAYNTRFDDNTSYAPGKAPRPILINTWYPARAADGRRPMRHRDYLPIFGEEFAHALVDELLEQGRIQNAAGIARLAETFGQHLAKAYADEGDLQRRYDSVAEAEEHYRKALLLDPSNAQATEGMNALRALGSGNAGR
jgi:hypothetical protein